MQKNYGDVIVEVSIHTYPPGITFDEIAYAVHIKGIGIDKTVVDLFLLGKQSGSEIQERYLSVASDLRRLKEYSTNITLVNKGIKKEEFESLEKIIAPQ